MYARLPCSALSSSWSATLLSAKGRLRSAIRSASLNGFSLFELPKAVPRYAPYPPEDLYQNTRNSLAGMQAHQLHRHPSRIDHLARECLGFTAMHGFGCRGCIPQLPQRCKAAEH